METKGKMRGRRFGEPGERRAWSIRLGRGRHGGRGEGPDRPDPRGRWREGHRGPGDRPWGRRGGRKVGRGDVRAAALALLSEQPLHGYEIIQQISARSGGAWRPSPGSVYPALQLLEDEGLVRAEQEEGRRVFHLTESGRAYVEERRDQLAAAWTAVAGTMDEGLLELRDLFEQLGTALRQVAQVGTAAEIAEARELLISTRRRLYRILAGGDADAGADRS